MSLAVWIDLSRWIVVQSSNVEQQFDFYDWSFLLVIWPPFVARFLHTFVREIKKKTNKVPIFTARMSTGRTKHHHVGNLIGDNYFNCRFNLIQLQSWLKAPLRSRSHMRSHITSGKSREKICISRQLNFFAFKLTI